MFTKRLKQPSVSAERVPEGKKTKDSDILIPWKMGEADFWSIGVMECWNSPILQHSITPLLRFEVMLVPRGQRNSESGSGVLSSFNFHLSAFNVSAFAFPALDAQSPDRCGL